MSATKSAWERAIYMIPDISVTEARSPVHSTGMTNVVMKSQRDNEETLYPRRT
jgi:hypothetical protein